MWIPPNEKASAAKASSKRRIMQAEAERMVCMRRMNLFSPEFDRASDREGYRWRGARIGKQLGAERVGTSVYELGDGERTFPYHFHHGMAEWLEVGGGRPAVRSTG